MAFEENYSIHFAIIVVEEYGDKHSVAYFLMQGVVSVLFFHPEEKENANKKRH